MLVSLTYFRHLVQKYTRFVVTGSLSPESLEPSALVIINGVMELVQVRIHRKQG